MSTKKPALRSQRRATLAKNPRGVGQLTLVEHALCPLSAVGKDGEPLTYQTSYDFPEKSGKRFSATATISAAFGLMPSDEFFLWGLLGLTFARANPSAEFRASPHAILRELGCIDTSSDRGGSAYRAFRASLKRLAGVRYHCDNFYDPIRREHRQVAFGLLSYSLPLDPACSRAWRIVWDPLFFEFCGTRGGFRHFDLSIYRLLDAASRRLYLFLAKIFWRRECTHWIDVRSLATNVLGFSPTIHTRNLKQKVKRAVLRLAEHEVVAMPNASAERLFAKRANGADALRLRRGRLLAKASGRKCSATCVPTEIVEPLRKIGLDDAGINWVAKQFAPALIQLWAEITLAAKERSGLAFFKKSPQAFFVDNLQKAAQGVRTPPDWWHDFKRQKERMDAGPLAQQMVRSNEPRVGKADSEFLDYLKGEGRAEFESLLLPAIDDLCRTGKSPAEAQKLATELCVEHLKRRFITSVSR